MILNTTEECRQLDIKHF